VDRAGRYRLYSCNVVEEFDNFSAEDMDEGVVPEEDRKEGFFCRGKDNPFAIGSVCLRLAKPYDPMFSHRNGFFVYRAQTWGISIARVVRIESTLIGLTAGKAADQRRLGRDKSVGVEDIPAPEITSSVAPTDQCAG